MSSPGTATLLKKSDVRAGLTMSLRTLEGMVKAGTFPPALRMAVRTGKGSQ
jgi:hypothetical protein